MATLGKSNAQLINLAYATDEALKTRIRIHEQYTVPPVDYVEWVVERVEWQGDETVLDIGAGTGTYFDAIRKRIPDGMLIGSDLVWGMAQVEAQQGSADLIINADAMGLPFPDNVFDIVLANHMLFHVTDLNQALTEIKRVLKPSGSIISATNSQFTMPEFDQLMRRALNLLGATGSEIETCMRSMLASFSLEEAAPQLSKHFPAVVRHDLPSAFVFPTKQPIMDYFNSMRTLQEPGLPRRVKWDDLMNVLGEQVQRLINHFGELVVNKLSGVVVATEAGGFAKDYLQKLRAGQSDSP